MPLSNLNWKCISFDTETTGLHSWGTFKRYGHFPARPFAFAFTDSDGEQAYIRWEVDPKTRRVIPEKKSQAAMSALLGDPAVIKIGHNIPFDVRMCRASGIKFSWTNTHDTQILSHIFTGGSLFSYALKPLCREWFDFEEDDQKALLDSVKKARNEAKKLGWAIATEESHGSGYIKSDYWLGDRKLCETYAVRDTERAIYIYLKLMPLMTPELLNLYKHELKLMIEIYNIEKAGIRILKDKIPGLEKFYQDYANSWKKKIEAERPGININSPKQLVTIFVDELKYKTRKKTKGGSPSIDATELKNLSEKHPLAKAILECKAAEAMLTKFIKSYKHFMVQEKSGLWVIHPSFWQTGTKTGRLSCSNPNMQQAAAEDSAKKRADIGLKPRELFGPRPGYVWYLPDFSQMEVWVFAFQAKYKFMIDTLLSGKDFHMETAFHVWGKKPDWEENKKHYRKMGKTMMFLKQYGGTSKAAAELLQCNRFKAQQALDEFDTRLPGINAFIEKTVIQIERSGFICNPFGRQYLIDERFAYKGVNYLIQGTCADVMKRAMVRLGCFYKKENLDCKNLLTLHDEIIIEVNKKEHSKDLQKKIVSLMQKDSAQAGLSIPLPITMKESFTTWAEAKEVIL